MSYKSSVSKLHHKNELFNKAKLDALNNEEGIVKGVSTRLEKMEKDEETL